MLPLDKWAKQNDLAYENLEEIFGWRWTERSEVKGAKKTMSENKAKKVKEIFSDYETKTNIKEAYVTALNVMKKTNTLLFLKMKMNGKN